MKSHWTGFKPLRAGFVLAAILVASTMLTAPANAKSEQIGCDYGTNHQVRVECWGTAAGYTAAGLALTDFYGHIDLWGPGIPRRSGPNGTRPTVSASGHGEGWVCAEGWRLNSDGTWSSVGLPCIYVYP